ncbi:MAG: 4-hydroxy-tetrahydrodipicolinate synthase [Fimbriimonadaceae bacterium]|nr:4-hydroxy-tetrahydrodipicolinate synthase [Fimbriimonadaceae bacterium]
MKWQGVFPAITTPFLENGDVDEPFLFEHVRWLIDQGCDGIVALGSLGEGATLTWPEKLRILKVCKDAIAGKVPLVAGVSGLSTAECVSLAKESERAGCAGLMVLPPYVYKGTLIEQLRHFEAVIRATGLSCMLYNNPIAYGVDVLPETIFSMAKAFENLHAVKESSADVRRITSIKALCGGRLAIFVGVDDLLLEGVRAGAVGWIAGMPNALPRESCRLFELAMRGPASDADRWYEWALPLLKLDVVPEFVQLIKLMQAAVGKGSPRVRAPRQELGQQQAEAVIEMVRETVSRRPSLIGV